jgi:hypothetical protein
VKNFLKSFVESCGMSCAVLMLISFVLMGTSFVGEALRGDPQKIEVA